MCLHCPWVKEEHGRGKRRRGLRYCIYDNKASSRVKVDGDTSTWYSSAYRQRMLACLVSTLDGERGTPKVRKESLGSTRGRSPGQGEHWVFHSQMAKKMYLATWAHPDILTIASFLYTRVQNAMVEPEQSIWCIRLLEGYAILYTNIKGTGHVQSVSIYRRGICPTQWLNITLWWGHLCGRDTSIVVCQETEVHE